MTDFEVSDANEATIQVRHRVGHVYGFYLHPDGDGPPVSHMNILEAGDADPAAGYFYDDAVEFATAAARERGLIKR